MRTSAHRWSRPLALVVLLAAALPACGDDGPATITATAGETGDPTGTDGMSSTSQGSASQGSASSTAGETGTTDATTTTTTHATTDDTTTDDTTTGEPGPEEFDAACEAVCDRYAECWQPNPFPDLASCRWLCARDYAPEAPGCVAATIAVNVCRTGASCDALNEFPVVECAAADAAKEAACPTPCEVSLVQQSAIACALSQLCPDEPLQAFQCEGDTCVCEVDGEEVGSCPAESVCQGGYPEWAAAASACCGFEL